MTKRFILLVIAITLYGLQFCIYVQNIDLPEFDYSGGFDVAMAQSTTLGVKVAERGDLSDKNAYYNMLSRYDWNADHMFCLMACESSFNPNAYNGERHKGCNGSRGLLQVACVHNHRVDNPDDLYDPKTNIAVAYQVWKLQGYRAWRNCHRRCS